MKLGDYLTKHQITSQKFSTKMKVSISTVQKWRIRNRLPRLPMIFRIERATKGSVKLKDWYH